MQIKIDNEKCTQCGDCMDICPVGAIIVESGHMTVTDKCVFCCACVGDCVTGAITFEK